MGKQQGRKPPKRKPKRTIELDQDLQTLALALDEHRLDRGIDGWFVLPWRDGWNAANLALQGWNANRLAGTPRSPVVDDLKSWIDQRHVSPAIYEAAEEHLGFIAAMIFNGNTPAKFLAVALRCAQLTIANSSGGGHTYNDILRRAFKFSSDERSAPLVLEARCMDAIGLHPTLRNDHNDRLRSAFTVAWKRGLYHAAYALPHGYFPKVD